MRGGKVNLVDLSVLNRKEWGYLSGLFMGDGYRHHDKRSRHYHVEFYLNSVRDKKIIIYIKLLLSKIGLNASVYKDKRCNCSRVRVYSKELFQHVTKDTDKLSKDKVFGLGFVSGIIDSKGHVDMKKSTISVINTDKVMLDFCIRILKSYGINSSISLRKMSRKDKLGSYRIYVSVTFKKLKHLSIKAGS